MIPGEILLYQAPDAPDCECTVGRDRITLDIHNTGDRPIQVGSHYHLAETNPALSFDRHRAVGYRLDIPAGTAVRLEPGDTTTVYAIPFGGRRTVRGFRSMNKGPLS